MAQLSLQELDRNLRSSPAVFLPPLLLVAIVLGMGEFLVPRPAEAINASIFFILVAAAYAVLLRNSPRVARLYCIVAYCFAVAIVAYLARNPWLLIFISFPTVVSGIVAGKRGMYITASALCVAIVGTHMAARRALPLWPALATITSVLGTAALVRLLWQPVLVSQSWLWESFVRARDLLHQARDTQVELRQELDAQAQAGRDLVLATERLAAMRLMAEDAQHAKSEFAANVSHEFRSPLNIIIGLAEILVDAPDSYGIELPAEVQRDIGILYRNAQHMSGLVDDVLDLSQVEAGRLSLRREWVRTDKLVESACEVVQPLLDDKKLYLLHDVPADLPETYCDPTRVRQILLNLVSNAARFTDTGGIRIGVRQEGPDTHFLVTDTGPGISPRDIGRIFEPFEQAIRSPGGLRSGSGLGLSICKRFVEMHEGTMWVDSTVDEGSTFHFRIPTRPPSSVYAPPNRWITEGWVRRRVPTVESSLARQQRIVLYDPTSTLQSILRRYADDIETVQIESLEALGQATDSSSPVLALINSDSPNSAIEALTTATESVPDLPIFGCVIPAREHRAIAAGAVDHLVKPVSQADLDSLLGRLGGSTKSIMVIDDDVETLWLMRRKLALVDPTLDIKTSKNGRQAVELLEMDPVDAILLDIVMPERDGWQVLEELRSRDATRDIPVVIVSARDPSPDPIAASLFAVGMGKSLSIHRMLSCIQTVAHTLLRSGQDTRVTPQGESPEE